ncbi:MAG: DUF1302 family protein [Rhizobiales bacterium]|nr:DUF1302 family protein [Hyphomicrobiales bacterium]
MPVSANSRFAIRDRAGRALRRSLFGSAALLAVFAASNGAQAATIDLGEAQIQIDTTVSVGASIRASERDCNHVAVASNNGCTPTGNKATGTNSDDGNRNFDAGDLTQATAKITSDIQGTWENYGFFLRPTAFYDYVYTKNDMEARKLTTTAQDALAHDVSILDAFVYGNWDVAGHYTTVRFGKQVLNWGESLFIQGGINQFQAVDVSRLRTPGSELKEALTPMPMLYVSTTLTGNLTVEAFWQFAYEQTQIDPSGSYWSTTDIAGKGATPALSGVAAGFDDYTYAIAPGDIASLLGGAPVPIAIRRTADEGQNSTNQFGLAAHYYADNIGTGTDFGLYYVRYSSRLPYLSFRNSGADFATSCGTVAAATAGAATCGAGTGYNGVSAAFAYSANQSTYYYQFPGSIDTVGASFSTTIGGTAVSGEATYTPNMPFAVESTQQNASQIDGLGASALLCGGRCSDADLSTPGVYGATQAIVYLNAVQGQVGTITSFTASDPLMSIVNADSGAFIFNAGMVYVPDANTYPLERAGLEAGLPSGGAGLLANGVTDVQYATKLSTGYQAVLQASYNNPMNLPITLTPSISFRHDVWGYSPGPITANFQEGVKVITLGVGAEYQSFRANISYTNYFGGGFSNQLSDRDFASASISYAF